MESVVQAFDVPSFYETEVFQLRYPVNSNLIKLVEGEIAQGVGRTSYDEASNTLIVSSIPEEMTKVRRIVGNVDRGTSTVLIEAKIIQVNLNDQFKMGVNWQYVNDKLDSLSIAGIFNILVPGDQGVTVMSGNLSENNYQFVIEALQTTGETNLLASPRIMAIEGEEARILVGNNVPYTTTDTREDAGGVIRTFEQVTYIDAGVKLVVNAQVNEDRVVILDIMQEVSNIVGFRDGIPETSLATSETVVAVPNGVTIVMAGLIQEEVRKETSKVPVLGSIPLLGALFRRTDNRTVKQELIVFLTPYITSGEATPRELKQLEYFDTQGL
jgi:general secretion pathway protein D